MNSPFYSTQTPPAGDNPTLSRRRRDSALNQVWQRLSPRLERSAEQARRHVTARAADMAREPAPEGVTLRIAYDIGGAASLSAKPGEPIRIRLVDLPAGGQIELPVDANADSAWLVLEGQIEIGGVPCATHDYQQRGAGATSVLLATRDGARLMVREARPLPCEPGSPAALVTTRGGQFGWDELAEGVSRRLLAPPQAGAAAFLVRMTAGAAAPPHRHGRAEECLLLEGEMYLDDILLFGGDFQLAHAGGAHHEASSEHGVLLLVHGDLDLDVIEAEQR